MLAAILRCLFFATAVTLCSVPAVAETPRVLASIKPLHSLAANIMEGVGQPSLLLRVTASPHTYSLRPSDARAIEQAQLIVWMGPHYESFMAKAVGRQSRDARIIAAATVAGVRLLPTREGGVWSDHEGDAHGPDEATTHGEGEHDMHVWLDPDNAKAIAQAIAAVLADLDPAHAAVYRGNANKLAGRLDALDDELRILLSPVAHRPFIVFHDAYQYLERRYGLSAAGSITVTPDRVPGPRRLSELRRVIAERVATCVFAEPQFTSPLVATLTRGTAARGATLDPLGVAVAEDRDGYFTMMRSLADAMVACLAAP